MGRSFGWRRRDGFEGGDDAGGPGAEAVVDVGGEFFGGGVAAAEHFEFGVDVVDVVEGDGFGGLGEDGGAEFEGAVMGGDEVEEVEADVLGVGVEEGPGGGFREVHEVAPEFVDEFEAEGDVAEHFAVEVVGLGEAGLGVAVFPHFAAVVEEDAGDEEVAIEVGIDGAEGVGGAHHLGDVLDEAAAACVVIFAGGGSAFVAVGEAFEEELAEVVEAGVGEGGEFGEDVLPVGVLTGGGVGVAEEEGVFFVFGEEADFGGAGFDAVFAGVDPFGGEFDEGGAGEVFELVEAGVAVEEAPEEGVGGVDEAGFEVGAAGGGGAFGDGVDLDMHAVGLEHRVGDGAEVGQGEEFGGVHGRGESVSDPILAALGREHEAADDDGHGETDEVGGEAGDESVADFFDANGAEVDGEHIEGGFGGAEHDGGGHLEEFGGVGAGEDFGEDAE